MTYFSNVIKQHFQSYMRSVWVELRTEYDRWTSHQKYMDLQNVRLLDFTLLLSQLSRFVGKPTMWFRNRSDTNRPVQSQKMARGLKFWI